MPHCAFLSIANTEGWFIDDDLVHAPLQELGWTVTNVPWDSNPDWDQFDIVVIRSPWDYQDHMDQFIKVLRAIEASQATLVNDLETVLWNINKNYLFELEEKGVELVPTRKATSIDLEDLSEAYAAFQTEELIIKPIIGANADDTFRIPKEALTDKAPELISVFSGRECMIQPFMSSIVEEGEFSLMYFNGQLSHVILKTVGAGDYRVQEEHGGGVIPIVDPHPTLLKTGAQAMQALEKSPLYARVDLVRTPESTFALMELELIEPCLYFRFDEASPMRFAQYIVGGG